MLYLAIDQHSKQLTVNLRNEHGEVILRRQVKTGWDSVRPFLESLAQQAEPEGGFVAVLEVTGFHDWLVKLLQEVGCRQAVLVQPQQRKKRKTDRRDANQLGELLWVNRHRLLAGQRVQSLRRVWPPSEQDAHDRQLTALRQRVAQRRTRVINRVKGLLRKGNWQHQMPTKGIQTKTARSWLAELSLPPMDRLEMDQLLEDWEQLDRQQQQLDEQIRQRKQEHRWASVVATAPGLSGYAALAIACRIGDIERFPRDRSLVNYFGLAPGCHNSGETERPGSITKEGSAIVRFLLGQAVLHVLKKDAWMRSWYRRVKARRGSKIARVAVMRRLAARLWWMIKYEMAYVAGGPEAFQKALHAKQTLRREAQEQAQRRQAQRSPQP